MKVVVDLTDKEIETINKAVDTCSTEEDEVAENIKLLLDVIDEFL